LGCMTMHLLMHSLVMCKSFTHVEMPVSSEVIV